MGFFVSANAAPLSGTKSVGPTGNYSSLTAAIADIQTQTLGGALILELQGTYVSTVETFPLTIPALNGASAVNTLTIRPASGATARVISSANTTAATVDLNGAQFVIIDGRPGDVGSNAGSGGGAAAQLTIENTDTSGVALRFINEASGNTIRYTTLRGVNTSASSGTVVFSTTTGASGNDNNTLDHCDLGDGASTPANGLYALGSVGTTAQNNSGNTVSNCNIFNFYSSTTTSVGVSLVGGNTDWTISGNSFYQTVSRTAVAANVYCIAVGNNSGNNFTVIGNYIGGSAPNAGGSAWTATGTTVAYRFFGISLNVGTTTPSSVQGNTIANIVWTSSSNTTAVPGVWSGIYVTAGSLNIGTLTGNTIGSGTGTGSISVTTSGSGGTSFGIGIGFGSGSIGTVVIANNAIGSITVNGSATSISASLSGIQIENTPGTITISNNTVGSTTTANSLNAATSSTSASIGQQVTGILSSNRTSASITGNTVANLNNNYASTATTGQIRGIVTSAGVTAGLNTITGNTVRNLSTTSQNTNTSTAQSVYGIIDTSPTTGQTVSQNTVHSLANTAASAAVSVTGIYFAAGTSGSSEHVIARNWVHSLAVSSISTGSVLKGIQFGVTAIGATSVQNNMVRVGLDASGNSTAGASAVHGIFGTGRNVYHNSVYVGGTQTSGTNDTVAFQSVDGVGARTFQNNIFFSARSNSGGTGNHYAVQYGGSGVNPNGLTAGGNLFLASGTGGVLGRYNSADRTTLAAWQAATGQDATSAVGNPLFVNPTGDAVAVDLHLQTSNPAEGGGIALTGALVTVTDDFDGQPRSSFTPADVGADAGNFTLTPGDTFAPGISYPLLSSGTNANRMLTSWATITDNSGSVASGANAPRLYFKKSTDADVFGGNTSADNGWKYVTATGSGPYNFTMDYSLIYGGSVSAGDTIQYFVVAQDAANNLGSSRAAASASANPPVQNINSKPGAGVNSFSILGTTLSGTKTVGSGGDYPSLSGAGGLFAALNASVLTGNVVVNITSDLTEDGSVTLKEFNATEYPATGSYTLTIQPDSATMRTISNTATGGLITLNGADRVTIDGRFGGNGRYLTFRKTSTGGGTIVFINDASNNTVRNCVVEGVGSGTTSDAVILFGFGTVTGNDNNRITGCQIRDRSDATGVPYYLIQSVGSSAAVANSDNTVSDNELFNFQNVGILINDPGNDSWTLSGNDIYEVNAATGPFGIYVRAGDNHVITGNYIHDLLTTGTSCTGIYFSGTGTTTIARNRITALNVNAATIQVFGIIAQGSVGSTLNVVNNQITLGPAASISTALVGLYDFGSSGSVVNAFYNSMVLGGTESGTATSWASYRSVASTHTARNNLFLNLRTGGTGSHFAAGSAITGGSYTASNNVYAGTGATAANSMDFSGTQGTAVPVSFATWQSSTGDTASQAGVAGTGNFTSAMFVNAATGDLHLAPGGNALVNALGTPIAGVTDDYEGEPRSAATPNIGSDEFFVPAPDIVIEQPLGTTLTDETSTIDLGLVAPGSNSAAKTFTIRNTGGLDLTLGAITKDGANAGDFSVNMTGMLTTLTPGSSTTFSVILTPSATGIRNAAIHIASNALGPKNPFDINLTGTTTLNVVYNNGTEVPLSTGSFTATGLTVNFTLNYAPVPGTELMVVRNTGLGFINGTFSNLAQGQLVALTFGGQTYAFAANYFGGTGNDLVLVWANTRALAWGANSKGQLGNNGTTQRNVPAAVSATGLLAGTTIISVAAGFQHSLALGADGTLAAWGDNLDGELGNGSTTDSPVPVAVSTTGVLAGKRVIAIAAGNNHSLALCSDGTLAAWGSNVYGQLGDGSSTPRNSPVAVDQSGVLAGKSVVAICAGGYQSFALCSDGTVAAWGRNSNGELGNNATTSVTSSPVLVSTAAGVSALAGKSVVAMSSGSGHSIALCADGTVVTWGYSGNGQLGNGDTSRSLVPVLVTTTGVLAGKTVTGVAAGNFHNLVVCSDGTLAAWGRNDSGQLGTGTIGGQSAVPVAVVQSSALAGKTVTRVSAGSLHSLARCADGTLATWGYNSNGQLGNNSTTISAVPVLVSGLSLAAGERWVIGTSGQSALHSLGVVAGPAAPQIAVSQPADTPLADAGTLDWGGVLVNSATVRTFTIENIGFLNLTLGTITWDGANAGDFAIGAPGATTLTPGASTTLNVTFTPAAVGARTAALHIASNVSGSTNPFDITLTGTGLTSGQNWMQQIFGTTSGTGDAAPTADPNHNGIPNIIEYALGGDPVGGSTGIAILPTSSISPTAHCMAFSLTRYLDRNDLTLTVQAADSLTGPWTNLARSINGTAFTVLAAGATVNETGSGNTRTVTVCDLYQTTDPAHPKRFMRLEVMAAP